MSHTQVEQYVLPTIIIIAHIGAVLPMMAQSMYWEYLHAVIVELAVMDIQVLSVLRIIMMEVGSIKVRS